MTKMAQPSEDAPPTGCPKWGPDAEQRVVRVLLLTARYRAKEGR
jgi:hypothetical protein